MHSIQVGKPFPGAYPKQQGAIMELTAGGLIVLIQFPRITNEELKAFKKSFGSYSYFESNTSVPVPVFIFPFPKPFGPIDLNLNARLVDGATLNNYLAAPGNVICFYLLDGPIVAAMKIVGLDNKCVRLFCDTIKKQLQVEYDTSDFSKYLDGLYAYSSDELFRMGKIFQKVKPVQNKAERTDALSASEIIEQCLGQYLKKGMKYPGGLPPELEKWYCYTIDRGHSILSILRVHYQEGMVFKDYLVPCPVKAVLAKGYEIKNGFVVADLPYSNEVGLMTDPEFDEF